MRLNWKGRGRKINGDYILDWDLLSDGSIWYVIMNHKTGKAILEMAIR